MKSYLDNASFSRKSRDLILLLLLCFVTIQIFYITFRVSSDDIQETDLRYERIRTHMGELLAKMQETSALSNWFFLNVGGTLVETVHNLEGHVHDGEAEVGMIKQKVEELLDDIHLELVLLHKEPLPSLTGIGALSEWVREIEHGFSTIYELVIRMGVDESMGEQGRTRRHAHRIEEVFQELNVDATLLASLLELRRREKDFLMRRDNTSLERFRDKLARFEHRISHSGLPLDVMADILGELSCYGARFEYLVEVVNDLNQKIRKYFELLQHSVQVIKKISITINNEGFEYRSQHQALLHYHSVIFFILVTLVLFLTGLLVHLVFRSIIHPVKLLKEHADRIAQGDYQAIFAWPGRGEIGELASHLQKMKETLHNNVVELEEKVSRRTYHLELTNHVLEDTVKQLQQMQDQMLQSEKMASLGRLVAGFAHEINTPIGIGVTTISNLPDLVKQLEQMLEQDEVDEAELNQCLASIRDNSVLGLANMRRAADLVTRFKRTSVDQSSERERRFNVMEILNDVVVSMNNTFKATQIAIKVVGPRDLMVCSLPGSLGQVFINLLMNSFKHGFDQGKRPGTIEIDFSVTGDPPRLHFRYRDNGLGIDPLYLKKIFEPFFTTARDSGGSGLGAFIIYNIVTGQLKGEITLTSVLGEGVEFNIVLPISDIGYSI